MASPSGAGPDIFSSIRWRFRETVVDGLERMPAALLGLYRGENLGKMVVRLDPSRG